MKWENGEGQLKHLMDEKKRLENYSSGIWIVWSRFVEKRGVCVGMMRGLPVTIYDGYAFDNNSGVIVPFDEENVSAIWSFCSSAVNLKKRLELILKGESPHDIFVRWKPIHKQPVGWEPDLNDGVRLNIRPFMTVGDVKKKGAGILRDKPNIHWKKDRGKDVESAPWYHLGTQYGGKEGDRINDHHLTLAEKIAAREASK